MNYEERLLELVKERDQAAQEAVDLRDEVARLRQRLKEMERGSFSGVCRELRLQLEAAEARVKELEAKERKMGCGYCGEIFFTYKPQEGETEKTEHVLMLKAFEEHDAKCPHNPLTKRIAELEAEKRKVQAETNELDDKYERFYEDDREPAQCADCGSDMQLVRPGKWQCDTCISDELIRRKQADAVLRAVRVLKNTTYAPPPGTNTFWAGVDHSITEMVNYSEAIRRGEVEI